MKKLKTMKMNNPIVILLMLCNFSCNKFVDHVYSIKIQNNSKDTVQFYASYNYPDISIDVTKPRLKMAYPNNYSYLDSKKEWKDVLPKDTILIYILNKDTVDTYSWDVIRTNYKVLKRYDLSLDDLKRMNWAVVYQ